MSIETISIRCLSRFVNHFSTKLNPSESAWFYEIKCAPDQCIGIFGLVGPPPCAAGNGGNQSEAAKLLRVTKQAVSKLVRAQDVHHR
jgi:hypothetical protein